MPAPIISPQSSGPTQFASRHRGGLWAALALALAASGTLSATNPPVHDRIVPELMPDPHIAGFAFPESEATLTSWITAASRGSTVTTTPSPTEKIHLHGWGLWTALTAETAQLSEGQRLRVFETWLTPEDLTENAALPALSALADLPRRRAPLRQPAQLAESVAEVAVPASITTTTSAAASTDRIVGYVKYDPSAAEHIVRQQLLRASALNALLIGGAQQIPPFPATALVVKPLFQVVKISELMDGRYYGLRVWAGPPAAPRPVAPTQWPGSVWIDVGGEGSGRGAIDPFPAPDGRMRTEATTYPLSSLIHYRLSAIDAAALNVDKPGTGASAGDYAILVAMHVAGREIARWTWQTFWWTPAPDAPPAPSSPAIASQRPNQLRGAARSYAMAQTYTMLTPDQPYVGGENVGAAVYAYNPWIEARFAPADLPDSQPGLDPNGQPAANNHGIQTNCMSCHAQANYNPNRRPTAPRFTGARYVDLTDPQFVGTLQVDFLWSIGRHAK